MFAHVNALQRDMCPSQTKFEGEVIAMALDLMHAEAVTDGPTDDEPAGLVTTGGTGSILHALLAYREHARETRGVTRPNFVKPETGHAAFDKGCHLFGIELRIAPVDPETTLADVDAMAGLIDDQTIAIMGSAGNYAYGTVDPIAELAELASSRGRGHARGRLPRRVHPAVRPGARATTSPSSTSGCPASPRSPPTPTSTATRSRAARRCCSATRRCARRSTSTSSTGAAASTCRRAWRVRARVA